MNPITLPNRPSNMPNTQAIREYELDGIMCRVILALSAGMVDNHIEIKAQAYQMDEAGNFMSAPNGYPSRTTNTTHTVNTTGIAAKSATLLPAWLRTMPEGATSVDAGSLPEGVEVVTTLPATAEVGERVYCDPYLYRWDAGIVELTAIAKAEELFNIVANSAPLSGVGFALS